MISGVPAGANTGRALSPPFREREFERECALSFGDGAVYVRAACAIVCVWQHVFPPVEEAFASRRCHTVPGRQGHHVRVRLRKRCACVEEGGVSGCSLVAGGATLTFRLA